MPSREEIKSTPIDSWRQLVDHLDRTPPYAFACRGEERFYPEMKAQIDRCLTPGDLAWHLRRERRLSQRFREYAAIHLSGVERDYLASPWLQQVVMQHYGAPTRLLDWSKSPWIAVYFAAFGGWDVDGYVYGFRRKTLEDNVQRLVSADLAKGDLPGLVFGPHNSADDFSKKEWDSAELNGDIFLHRTAEKLSDWVATYYCRAGHFPRPAAQQGFFTFASKPGLDHWTQITAMLSEEDHFVLKIARHAKPEILRNLYLLGLDGATLFPGLNGIGSYLEGLARIWTTDYFH